MQVTKCYERFAVAFALFVCVFFQACAGLNAAPKHVPSRNEQLTSEAWTALGENDFRKAIAKADRCIESFEASAVKIQNQLEKTRARVPKGEVTEKEKEAIHKNGLLNDVATCFFIKGKAYESLKERDAAIVAYTAAAKLTYARAWDPSGPWFWSPAEAATERLEELR